MSRALTAIALGTGAALALTGCETMAVETAEAVETTYRADLRGGAEVPGPGDPDGSGTAEVTIVDGADRLCYDLRVSGIAPATAAHIHRGSVGEAGPPVIPLEAPADGSARGCIDASDALTDPIEANPSGFYVNVHNAEYPGGAVRGQLRR